MSKTKIVLIGAGSTSFGVNSLADLFTQRAQLHGSHIALCDTNSARLAPIAKLADKMNAATDAQFTITSTTDYRDALADAEFVIVSVEIDRLARWKLDWEIPFKYGIKHVLGENGGPGGLSHALRTIDLVLGIAEEVEQRAPDAYLLNFTNPLSRVCLALTRYTQLNVIGLCHQIGTGYFLVAQVLGLIPNSSEHFPTPELAEVLKEKIDLQTAGLNHVTWIQAMRDRHSGRDLYPEFRDRLRDFDPAFEPLSRRLFSAFGLYPATGDGHVGEYFSYAWETSELKGYDFDGRALESSELDAHVEQVAESPHTPDEFLDWDSGERAVNLILSILNNTHSYELTVNVQNNGALPGLPDWAIVELPGIVSANGIMPIRVPPLPTAITAMLNQQVAIQDLVVRAAVHGDRNAAFQALLMDPLVTDYSVAEKMLDEFLTVHCDLLPRFRK